MQEWIARHNIEDLERLLSTISDPEKREVIEQLIADERERVRGTLTGPPAP
jgi:hypothetical protein